ncbi:MAG: peptidoglycan recognition family protein, partial [Bradymonadaceae bacterium]
MRRTLKQLSVLLLAAIWLMACGEEWSTAMVELGDDRAEALIGSTTELVDYDDIDPPHAGADPMYEIVIESPEDTARLFADGFARLDAPMDFRQVSWMMDAHDVSELQYRAMTPQGAWTDWEDVHVYWSEGIMHNARILLDFPTREIQLRGGESIIATTFEFHEEVIARAEIVTAENQPGQPGLDHRPEDDLRSTQQAVAPTSLVIPRSTWRAINPSKVCGSVVAPYRMTIHHTAIPSGDGGDAAARMRGMQSHHINANGWCDIGYHFVVAQTGKIYQGRSRSNRPGAHTLNTNSGNVGIAFIANFQSQTPTDTQLNAGAKIVKWNHDKHGIALNRTRVKGHREWPGQSTTCPGANMINRISTILTRAAGSAPPPPPPPPEIKYDVKFKVNFLGLENFYKQGSSADLLDAMPGDTFRAEILITNDSDEAIRGVELGYRVYTPY